MGDISKNFSMAEFGVSAKAAAAGIRSDIPENAKPAIRALVLSLLQPICDAMGWRCRINSGYRSPEVNRLVGGAATSQHLKGEAADCVFLPDGLRALPIDVLRIVTELGLDFDQMIAYDGFVHLSYTTTRPNRKQVLYDKNYAGVKI